VRAGHTGGVRRAVSLQRPGAAATLASGLSAPDVGEPLRGEYRTSTPDEPERVDRAYGSNAARLIAAKKAYDPGNIFTVFPDLVVTNEDVILSADGSKVAVRSVGRGTHVGEVLGIPATGKRAEFRAFDIHHLRDGVIVRTWHLEDFFGLARQLGAQVVPPQS
jgi:predicted ester cyclase